jgi:glycosyltransferase involved in cell wall biosynthesis
MVSVTEASALLDAPRVSVVVPTFRRPGALEETLRALVTQDYPTNRYEVIVIDDGSGDATQSVAESFAGTSPEVRYVQQTNAGAAAARNHGARVALGNVLIFVDDDIVVRPTHVRQHVAVLAEYGDCLVNGHWEFSPAAAAALAGTPFGRFRVAVEQWVKEGIAKAPLEGTRTSPAAVTACNLSLPTALFWRIGAFDATFPRAGYEDQEFSRRAAEAGCQFVYDRSIELQHNDQRLTLRQFCERQRQGAFTAVILAWRHPGRFSRQPLITENAPIRRGERPALAAKKLTKLLLSRRPALTLAYAAVGVLERVQPNGRLLRRVYWSVCGLYIFLGVREAVAEVGDPAFAVVPDEPRVRS